KSYDRDKQLSPTQKEKMRQYSFAHKGDDNLRFSHAKSQAKRRQLEWTLTIEIFSKISNEPCYYCKEKLLLRDGLGGSHLDRMDNTKGYTEDNVVSCCKICNTIRNNYLTMEETKI